MFQRPAFLILLLAAAVGVPYLSTTWQGLAEHLPDAATEGKEGAPSAENGSAAARPPEKAAEAPPLAPRPLPRPAPIDLDQVFDFGITPAWVLGRWPRVSTRLADIELLGYRVPLVSGTRPDDLAGSLTYYFNSQQELERISFQGTTADGRRLIALLERKFGFKRQLTTDPNLYLYQVLWSDKPKGQLWFQPADVVAADNRYGAFQVRLAIDRPSSYSPYAPQKAGGGASGWGGF
jgi:hypothetical protein